MPRYIQIFCYSFLMLSLALPLGNLASDALAAESPPRIDTRQEPRMPLVVIRFNQSNVYFERALYNAVNKAVQTKPDVSFDVVLLPGFRTDSFPSNDYNRVVGKLREFGIAPQLIRQQLGEKSGQRHDEVYIYVR